MVTAVSVASGVIPVIPLGRTACIGAAAYRSIFS